MANPELVANLWYVHDEDGFIFSLRVRLYALEGSDETKLIFLRKMAMIDYMIGKPFPIPKQFHTRFSFSDQVRVLPVVHMTSLAYRGSEIQLFDEALTAMEAELPANSPLSLGQNLLVVVTPLESDGHDGVRPSFTKLSRI